MHIHTLHEWQHSHKFSIDQSDGEKNTRLVVILTASMMVIELAAGFAFGSIALLADGWHMGTHVAALGITLFAYRYANRYADNPRYSFGTGKVGVLGGFASAIALAVVAVLMGLESIESLFVPREIHFNEAISVAVIGLVVNLLSAYLLHGSGHHSHHHHSNHEHHDHNLRAAYLHVLADAMTSLFAIFALLASKSSGSIWLDSVMGIVGAIVITRWAYGLLVTTSGILLDSSVDTETTSAIRTAIEQDADNRVSDLHVWQVAPGRLAAIISIVTHYPQTTEHYKKLLKKFDELSHITIEIYHCTSEPCLLHKTPDA